MKKSELRRRYLFLFVGLLKQQRNFAYYPIKEPIEQIREQIDMNKALS